MSTSQPPEAVLAALRNGHRFVLSGHVRPDGDSLGSALGLARVLRSLGKGVLIWNRDDHPTIFGRLPGADRIHRGEAPPDDFPEAFDTVVTLECPTLDRTGLSDELSKLSVINLDHHLGNDLYGAVNWVDTAAPALGVMIQRLAKALGVEIDAGTASALYVALMTDTGGFRHGNTTAEAFEAAAHLVRAGARPDVAAHWIYESVPAAAVRLTGEMLRSLELHHDGRVASVALTAEMFDRAGATEADAEDLVDSARSIDGVEAVLLLRQTGDERFKGSLRSRGAVDVERIARRRNGGGHKNASGFEVEGNLEELRDELIAELAGAVDE